MTKDEKNRAITILEKVQRHIIEHRGLYMCPLIDGYKMALDSKEFISQLKKLLWKNRVGCELKRYVTKKPWWKIIDVSSRVNTIKITIEQLRNEIPAQSKINMSSKKDNKENLV